MVDAARSRDAFEDPVGEVARRILGDTLLVDGVGGVIVEVERYQEDDPASHSFGGRRGRAAVMLDRKSVV